MPDHETSRAGFFASRRTGLAFVGAGLLAIGGAAGAMVMAETRPSVSMAPATPVTIRSLSSAGIVTIRGRAAEVFGNKFVVDDGTGRALVDTGPEGDRHALVTAGSPVTVQGRFERGIVHAAFLVGADRKILALGPLAGPRHGPHDGSDCRPGAPPPPPPGAVDKAPPPSASSTTVPPVPPPAAAHAR